MLVLCFYVLNMSTFRQLEGTHSESTKKETRDKAKSSPMGFGTNYTKILWPTTLSCMKLGGVPSH